MNPLGNRIGTVVPCTVTFLLVGWNGIVNDGLNSIFGQIPLQLVPISATDREDMEYVCVGVRYVRQYDFRIIDMRQVIICDGPTVRVVCVQMVEFRVEYGGFDFIESTVAAGVPENIFLC